MYTQDGISAQVWIDGTSYDINRGQLFLVSAQDGETWIEQIQRDLTTLTPSNASIEALAVSDGDVAKFVERFGQP